MVVGVSSRKSNNSVRTACGESGVRQIEATSFRMNDALSNEPRNILQGMLSTLNAFKLGMIVLLVGFMALNLNKSWMSSSIFTDVAIAKVPCNMSDPKAVSAYLKEQGLESIYDRLPQTKIVDDPWSATLFARLDRIQLGCGTLCQLNTGDAIKNYTAANGKGTLPLVQIPDVDCRKLLGMEEIDAGIGGDLSVPKDIPNELYDYFTIGHSYEKVVDWMRSDVYLGGDALESVWTREEVESQLVQLATGDLHGTYGHATTNGLRDMFLNREPFDLRNKSILVIGSEKPWVEVICLYAGARHVTTLEYGRIVSQHPQISTMTPDEFRSKYKNVVPETTGATMADVEDKSMLFDGVVSYSSLEHSGLGRYGDAINPWGDMLAVARAWCVTKNDPSSFMLLGLPTGADMIYSNWHRVYGKVRWPLVAANWRHVDHTDVTGLERHNPHGGPGGGTVYRFEKVVP